VDIDEAMFNAVLAEQQKPSGPPEGEPLDAVSLTHSYSLDRETGPSVRPRCNRQPFSHLRR
jgi:hypothetical protein